MTGGERNAEYTEGKSRHIKKRLNPFFGDTLLADVTAGMIQDYRMHRMRGVTEPKTGKVARPARATLHSEFVTLRQILKSANRRGWISALPDMSSPYKASMKIGHRAWFSPDEYKTLYEATRERAANPRHERWRNETAQFHDYVLFMANTGLRPDEAARLQYRDVTIAKDDATAQTILEIEVRGKRGVGYCKSMTGAVVPFRRLVKCNDPQPSDEIFGRTPRELLNTVLAELDLKTDRDGNVRTAYSLRHTYICLRLMEGAAAINVRRAKPPSRTSRSPSPSSAQQGA